VAAHRGSTGPSERQFGVLEALDHLGPMHQWDLAERILKTSGNVTVVIKNKGTRWPDR
jgi:MarR family 2-MHQ and catechol resistance regulon transcriptional repressor